MSRRRLAPATALLALSLVAPVAGAEEGGPIEDNSFLVEEAYNQEARIVQHIGTWMRRRGGAWNLTFTQEWPAWGQRHQLSYTIAAEQLAEAAGAGRGLGDVALHYRLQWLGLGAGRVAFAPRLSALLPTGDRDRGLGAGAAGVQVNLPLSVNASRRWVAHTNAGATWVRAAGAGAAPAPATRGVNLAQSLIWLAAPTLNVMLELAWDRSEAPGVPGDADREESLLLAPGLRWAHDFPGGLQIVPGIAAPIGLGPSRGARALFLYLSFEHGF